MFFSKMKTSRLLAGVLAVQMVATSIPAGVMAAELTDEFATEIVEVAEAALEEPGAVTPAVTEIPGTYSTEKEYDITFNGVTGFASVGGAVKDRSEYLNTDAHKKVSTTSEFLEAVAGAKTGSVKIIELTADIDLGYNKYTAAEKTTYSGIIKEYKKPSPNSSIKNMSLDGFTNPEMRTSGVTSFKISDINGLTIFSKNGYSISHAELNINRNANDIIIRNIHFKNMWQWDDDMTQKAVGWSNLKLNEGHNIWIDHCSFDAAFDGNIDIENGASGISITWCKIGMTPEEATLPGNAIYNSITFMEELYTSKQLTSGYYKTFRDAGASALDMMMFSAYHDKCHLCGSGDKDCIDYSDAIKDSNGNIRLTLAYNHYLSIGQRLPMIRQGSGHLINCYIDDTYRKALLEEDAFKTKTPSNYKMSRCINARNGASIAADSCVFNGVEQPIIGAERQGLDPGNLTLRFQTFFENAINHSLVVNSKVINSKGTYVGSSWDNNGSNAFTSNFTWDDKSTIGNWAWSNTITNYDGHNKGDFEKIEPYAFEFSYDPTETLPYEYYKLPLESVETVVGSKSGANIVEMSDEEWCAIAYNLLPLADVEAQIAAIAPLEYTEACKARIDAATVSYNQLSIADQLKLSNLDVYKNAVATYKAVGNAITKINAIGVVEGTESCKARIDEARTTYDALTEDQKAIVTNTNVLTEAEYLYKVADAIVKINAIGVIEYTAECKARLDEARATYDALTEEQKAAVTNADALTAAEKAYNKAGHVMIYNVRLAPTKKGADFYTTSITVDYGEGVNVDFVNRFRSVEENAGPWEPKGKIVNKQLDKDSIKTLNLVKPGTKLVEKKTYPDFVKTGYTFKNWNYKYYEYNKSKKVYIEKVKTVTALNQKTLEAMKLVPEGCEARTVDVSANWIENTYNVNYQLVKPDKKAKIEKLKDEKKKVKLKNLTKVGYETTEVTLPDETYISCEGYKLAGWTTDVAAKKNPVKVDLLKVSPGATIIEPATTHTKLAGDIKKNNKVVFYAVWEKVDDK